MKKNVSVLLVLVLLLSIAGCNSKSDDPNIGKWNAVSASIMGIEMGVSDLFDDGVTLELAANGKFSLRVDGARDNGKWEYTGNGLKMTIGRTEMTANLSDGMLTITNLLSMGISITFEKEGGYASATSGAKDNKATYYVLDTMTDGDTVMQRDMLLAFGLDWYILLNADGTARVKFDHTVNGTWKEGTIDLADAGVLYYTLKGDVMSIDLDGETITFRQSNDMPPEDTGNDTPVFPDGQLNELQQWWNGNWYGFIYLYGADGVWESLDSGMWDCFGTIESDEMGDGSIYLWDDGGELADVAVSITEYGVSSAGVAMSQSGNFNLAEIEIAEWIIDPGANTQTYEHLIIIDGTFADPRGSDYGGFMYEIWLRPWGILWSDVPFDDQPPGYYNWYLDRYLAPMPTMEELMGDETPQTGTGTDYDGSSGMTTVDFDAFTVDYPAGTYLDEDWTGDKVIKEDNGVFEVQFAQQGTADRVASVRTEMDAYLADPEAKGATVFERTIGGMSDVYCIKYDSIIRNEAIFSIAYPQPINGYAGVQLRVRANSIKNKIDDVLALPEVQAILDSIVFKNG